MGKAQTENDEMNTLRREQNLAEKVFKNKKVFFSSI